MLNVRTLAASTVAVVVAASAAAGISVDYTVDAGGNNNEPLNGLRARGTFSISGTTLTILLENTSTGVPSGFEVSDSLLVSLGFMLPDSVRITDGISANIGAGSSGLGQWSDRGAGDSVAEQWLWTNDFGGDLMEAFPQIISTSNGQGGGDHKLFDGTPNGNVGGPFGGIAADPPHRQVPGNQFAVSDSIEFVLTLNGTLSDEQLRSVARGSMVEFGSDQRYLTVPAPGAMLVVGLAGFAARRRRRSA